MAKLKWVTKSVSFSCQDTPKFTKSVSFPSAFVSRGHWTDKTKDNHETCDRTFREFSWGGGWGSKGYPLDYHPCPRYWQLPDGVRTNGVVAEVPRFPLINFHGNMLAKYNNMLRHMAKCGNMCALNSNYDKHVRDLRPFCENPVCPDPVWKPVTIWPVVRIVCSGHPCVWQMLYSIIFSSLQVYLEVTLSTLFCWGYPYIYIYIYTHTYVYTCMCVNIWI